MTQSPETGAMNRLYFLAIWFRIQKVKELLTSVQICQSYRKNKSSTIFMAHGVYIIVIN